MMDASNLTDDQVKERVARCARWGVQRSSHDGKFLRAFQRGDRKYRLSVKETLSLDDVAAACNADNLEVQLHRILDRPGMWDATACWEATVFGFDGYAYVRFADDPAYALAYAMIDAYYVDEEEGEDEHDSAS